MASATRFLPALAASALLAPLAQSAPAQDDPVGQLARLLRQNDYEGDSTEVAVGKVVEAAAVEALPILLDGLDRFSELLGKSEVEMARAVAEVEGAKARGGDEGALTDSRVGLETAQRIASTQRRVLDAVVDGLPRLLDAIADARRPEAIPALVASFESESQRVVNLEKQEEELDGKLAQLSARLFEIERDSELSARELESVRSQRAEARARAERASEALAAHRRARLRIAEVTARLLQTTKGDAVDSTLMKVEKHVSSGAPPGERVQWIDLYARLGKEGAPKELLSESVEAAKTLKKGEKDLEKLREQYARAKDNYFKAAETGGGMVSVSTKNAFESLHQQVTEAAAAAVALERLRDTAARAVGAAVAWLPLTVRDKALRPFLDDVRGERDLDVRVGLLEGCGALDEVAVRETLRKLIVEDREVHARLAALEALCQLNDAEAMEIVRARLLVHENWRVRVAAVLALVRVPQKESIPLLIRALDAEVGRVREDITQALQQLTGQRFAMSAPVWQKWWDDHGADFRIEDVSRESPAVVAAWDESAQGKVTFYGISSVSSRVCFVLDVSKSMFDPIGGRGDRRKIDLAKEQLKQAIAGLRDGDQLMIVMFAGSATRWAPKMTKVTDAVKQKLAEWVDEEIELGSGTNIHDGLKEAFTVAGLGSRDSNYESAIDTIFFLSDGDATVGEVTDPYELRRLVRDWNRLSRIKIHTIGVGEEPNIALLYGIAEDSGGQFQHR